jgi:hypothetical protein
MMMLEIITSTSSSYHAPGLSSAPVKRDSFPKSVIISQRLALGQEEPLASTVCREGGARGRPCPALRVLSFCPGNLLQAPNRELCHAGLVSVYHRSPRKPSRQDNLLRGELPFTPGGGIGTVVGRCVGYAELAVPGNFTFACATNDADCVALV